MLWSWWDHDRIIFLSTEAIDRIFDQILTFQFFEVVSQDGFVFNSWLSAAITSLVVYAMNSWLSLQVSLYVGKYFFVASPLLFFFVVFFRLTQCLYLVPRWRMWRCCLACAILCRVALAPPFCWPLVQGRSRMCSVRIRSKLGRITLYLLNYLLFQIYFCWVWDGQLDSRSRSEIIPQFSWGQQAADPIAMLRAPLSTRLSELSWSIVHGLKLACTYGFGTKQFVPLKQVLTWWTTFQHACASKNLACTGVKDHHNHPPVRCKRVAAVKTAPLLNLNLVTQTQISSNLSCYVCFICRNAQFIFFDCLLRVTSNTYCLQSLSAEA